MQFWSHPPWANITNINTCCCCCLWANIDNENRYGCCIVGWSRGIVPFTSLNKHELSSLQIWRFLSDFEISFFPTIWTEIAGFSAKPHSAHLSFQRLHILDRSVNGCDIGSTVKGGVTKIACDRVQISNFCCGTLPEQSLSERTMLEYYKNEFFTILNFKTLPFWAWTSPKCFQTVNKGLQNLT